MRKFKAAALLLVMLLLVLSLSGCGIANVDAHALLAPPKADADQQEIDARLKDGNPDLKLVYPKAGEYRSAIIMKDFTGDGREDALGFYFLETGSVEVQFLVKSTESGNWQTVARFKNAATQVDRVLFGDLSGDGADEVVIGWGSTSLVNAATVNVYAYIDGAMTEIPVNSAYGEMVLTDFNSDECFEIFLTLRMIPATEEGNKDTPAKSAVFEYQDHQMVETASARADNTITGFSSIVFGGITDGLNGVFLDGTRADSSRTTQVFFFDNEGSFRNFPFSINDATVTNPTFRPAGAAYYNSRDIDGDGFYEIPTASALPLTTSAENSMPDSTSFLVHWRNFDGTDSLRSKMFTLMNMDDGYFFEIPPHIAGRITAVHYT